MGKLQIIFATAASNRFIILVLLAIVGDTLFGCFRAIKEHKFNSNFGIDGAIRKASMVAAILFFVFVDYIVQVNLIGFIPQEIRDYLNLQSVGMTEFFALLFIAYEAVSIIKNMTLCGLPVKKVWIYLKNFLNKYTDELPDDDELEKEGVTYEDKHNRIKSH
ncbi:protein UtxA [Clostridium sp. CAG:590]|nr:protein UtxA [Clostridium sp. CAG:590]